MRSGTRLLKKAKHRTILGESVCYLPSELRKCLAGQAIHYLIKFRLRKERQRVPRNSHAVAGVSTSSDKMGHCFEFALGNQLKRLSRLEAEAVSWYCDLCSGSGARLDI